MADVIDNMNGHNETHEYASNSKGNAALTLGIIGTALGAMNTIGNGFSLFGGGSKSSDTNGGSNGTSANVQIPHNVEEAYLERKMNADYIDITKQYYENKIASLRELTDSFYKLDKQDTDNSFKLYKYSRDNKDELNEKISALQSKVDVMAAVRPYQDALIDARIHDAEQRADMNLMRRTCKMIEGQLVLADSSISGFPSYQRNNG